MSESKIVGLQLYYLNEHHMLEKLLTCFKTADFLVAANLKFNFSEVGFVSVLFFSFNHRNMSSCCNKLMTGIYREIKQLTTTPEL